MKLRLTAKFRVALGQVGLTISILLLGVLLGLVPDRQGAIRQSRASLAESVALNVHGFLTDVDDPRMVANLTMIVDRNPDLLSAAVREVDGPFVRSVGDHDGWLPLTGGYSTESQIRVPLLKANQQVWGYVELRFAKTALLTRLSNSEVVPLLLFMGSLCFIVFYAYLGKMLKHLDPSRAIPPRVRSALDTMAEGLLVLDRRGQIVLANQALADIVGIDVDDLLGVRANKLKWQSADGRPLDEESTPWVRCLLTGQPEREAVVRLVDRQQFCRTFLVNCSPVMVSGGKHGGVLVSLDDVTQLEEKKHELARARDAAEAANQAKSDFLANMSHEIRTPLNAILGFTEVLRRGYGKEQQDPRKHLSTIHSSGQHLLRLINDILDLSKVESGRMEVECLRCSPIAIIQEVVQVLHVKADEKKISLTLKPIGAVPETIFTDPARLRQIVTNLVGNAIKFTESGGVEVTVALANHAGAPSLQVGVIDSGIGMSPTQMEGIFDPFSQADSSVTRRFGGTGLGLTISRRFAKTLGGDIEVTSDVGLGSRFVVTISTGDLSDVELISADQLQSLEYTPAVAEDQWQFAKQRVLVVDDGEENRELMTLVLQEAGLEVDVAENGQVGVRKLLENLATEKAYEIVLMDMQMPVMDGFTATRLLRDRGVTTPIYALTANAMKGFEKHCLDVGCTGYLTKPIEIDLLLDALGRALNASRALAESVVASEPRSREVRAATGDPTVDFVSTHVRTHAEVPVQVGPLTSQLPMNRPEFRRLVAMFIPRLKSQLQLMEGCRHEGDFDRLADLAHWLKGTGGTVGFHVFTEPARILQAAAETRDDATIDEAMAELTQLASRLTVAEPLIAGVS